MKINVKKIANLTGHKGAVYTLTNGISEGSVLSGGGEGWVIQWNLEDDKRATVIAKVEEPVFSIGLLRSRNWLVVGNNIGGVHWIDLKAKKDLRNIQHHERGVFDIAIFGEDVFTLGGKGKLTHWNLETQLPKNTIRLTYERLRSCDYNEERNELVVGASDNHVYFLDKDTLEVKRKIENAHNNSVFVTKYSPNGKLLFTGGRDALLKVWDLENDCQEISSQPAHWYTINHISFHPKGHLFATSSRDKTIKIWDTATFQLLKVIDVTRQGGHINSVNSVFWSKYKDILISCSDDRTVMSWEVTMDDRR